MAGYYICNIWIYNGLGINGFPNEIFFIVDERYFWQGRDQRICRKNAFATSWCGTNLPYQIRKILTIKRNKTIISTIAAGYMLWDSGFFRNSPLDSSHLACDSFGENHRNTIQPIPN